MSDAISEALARAEKATPAATTPTPVASTPVNAPPGRPRSLSDAMATAGTSVDNWLGVKEGSFTADKVKLKNVDTIKVKLSLSEVKFGYGVRYMSGGRPVYAKSYDGVTNSRGGSWAETVTMAQQNDPTCKGSYDLADIPMTLREDIDVPQKGKIPAGKKVGYTTSVTGYGVFMRLVNEVVPKYGTDATVDVILTLEERSGNGNDWSVMKFDLDQ